jgi:hypothetical protein
MIDLPDNDAVIAAIMNSMAFARKGCQRTSQSRHAMAVIFKGNIVPAILSWCGKQLGNRLLILMQDVDAKACARPGKQGMGCGALINGKKNKCRIKRNRRETVDRDARFGTAPGTGRHNCNTGCELTKTVAKITRRE